MILLIMDTYVHVHRTITRRLILNLWYIRGLVDVRTSPDFSARAGKISFANKLFSRFSNSDEHSFHPHQNKSLQRYLVLDAKCAQYDGTCIYRLNRK